MIAGFASGENAYTIIGMKPVPIARQIACAKRELAMRQKFYPQWIKRGRLTQAVGEEEIATMTAIVGTLSRLNDQGQQRLFGNE